MSSHEIDTIVLGVPCTIKFDYQPYEAADTGPDAMYPGCDEDFEITQVTVGDVDVTEWMNSGDMEDYFYDAVGEAMSSQQEQWLEDRAESRYEEKEAYDDYYSQRH